MYILFIYFNGKFRHISLAFCKFFTPPYCYELWEELDACFYPEYTRGLVQVWRCYLRTLCFHVNLKFPLGFPNRISRNARVISAVLTSRIRDNVAKLVNAFIKFDKFCFARKIRLGLQLSV